MRIVYKPKPNDNVYVLTGLPIKHGDVLARGIACMVNDKGFNPSEQKLVFSIQNRAIKSIFGQPSHSVKISRNINGIVTKVKGQIPHYEFLNLVKNFKRATKNNESNFMKIVKTALPELF